MSVGKTNERGFSLMEVMIAVSILTFIGMLTFGVFTNTMKSRDAAAEITSHYHSIRQAMLRMTREVSMAFLSIHKDCEDPRNDTLFALDRQGGGYRLDFTSFGHFRMRADANESDQNEVSYYVDRDPDDSKKRALMRRSQPRIDEDPDEGGDERVLARGINRFEVEVYDDKQDRWIDEWDTRNLDFRDRLPMFVRFTLKVDGLNGKEEIFTTKARVFLRDSISFFGTNFARCPQ